MENSFNNLGISEPILKALEDMGFQTPTEVQSRAIPHILNNEDLIVMSKTGSGKTAVFGVSMLQMTDPEGNGPQGLILTPVRELAVQVDSDIKKMGRYLNHKTTAVYGQHSINTEIQALKNGVSIVTGTPGRVFDHIQQGNLVTKNIRFLVLDEADRMLDMGFLDQVKRIIRSVPKNRVTLLFSATMPPEIHRICSDYMKNPETIEIESQTKTVDTIQQEYYRVQPNEKRTQLNRLLLVEQPESCMIFCNTRMAVDKVQSFLTKQGYASEAIHGDIPQGRRTKTISEFKQGKFHILVATDVAARGIHIDNLSLVINYDVPVEKDSYVHRIGRTGRAGNGGRALSLVTSDDIMSLYEIEEHIGAMIPEADLPSEELFTKRSAEAQSWLEANKLKEKPARAPRKASSLPSGKSKPASSVSAKSKAASSVSGKSKAPSSVSGKAAASSSDSGDKGIRRQSSKNKPVKSSPEALKSFNKSKPYSDRKENVSNKITGKPAVRKSGGEIKQNSGKDRFDRRNYTNRTNHATNHVSKQATATNAKIAPSIESVQSPASTVKNKKPFLKRLLESILGK